MNEELHFKLKEYCIKAAEKEYGASIPEAMEKELYYFMHDWIQTVKAEIESADMGIETPSEMLKKFSEQLRKMS